MIVKQFQCFFFVATVMMTIMIIINEYIDIWLSIDDDDDDDNNKIHTIGCL